MKGAWPALGQQIIQQSVELQIEHVLLEYEGPQITLATLDGMRHLGVAADENDCIVRWIYSPITNLELQALASASQTTRDALLKRNVFIVDVDHNDRVVGAWKIPGDEIEERALPKSEAVLPADSRLLVNQLYAPISLAEISLEQLGRRLDGIPFKSLSQVINVFQRLWIALAAAGEISARGRYVAGLEDRAMLSFAGATAGSLNIRVRPNDEQLYGEVSKSFAALISAGEDVSRIGEVIGQPGSRVDNRYRELLSTLQRNDMQLMAYAQGAAAFLGPEKAERILRVLTDAKNIEITNLYSAGYFLTFSIVDKKFEFVEIESDRHFKGEVDPDVLVRNRAITVGEEATYSVIIEVASTHRYPNGPEVRHRLRAAVESDSATTAQPD